jgi:hypothetical protein
MRGTRKVLRDGGKDSIETLFYSDDQFVVLKVMTIIGILFSGMKYGS